MDGACHREPLSPCFPYHVSGRAGSRHAGRAVLSGMDGSDRRSRAPQLLDLGEPAGQRVLRRRRDSRRLGGQHVLRPGALPAAVQPPRRSVRHGDRRPPAPPAADPGWRPVRSLLVFTFIPADLEVRCAAGGPVAYREPDHLGPRDLRRVAGALPGVCRGLAEAGPSAAAGIAIHVYLERTPSSAMLMLRLSTGSVSFLSMASNAEKALRSDRAKTIAPFTSGSFSEEYAATSARSVDSSPP